MKYSGKYAVFSFIFDVLDLILCLVACTCCNLALFSEAVFCGQIDSLFTINPRKKMKLEQF